MHIDIKIYRRIFKEFILWRTTPSHSHGAKKKVCERKFSFYFIYSQFMLNLFILFFFSFSVPFIPQKGVFVIL